MFADDICLFNPSLVGLQNLLNTCYNYNYAYVAYNDSYRILLHIPRCASARNHQVQSNIDTLDALIRKHISSIIFV